MNRYFDTCNTLEEAHALYRALAKKNHPDMGGDLRTMQEINAQFAEFCATFTRRSEYERQQEAHKNGKKTAADFHDMNEVTEALRQRIEWALNNLPADCVVELIGLWVYITGNTRPNADKIGKAGLGFFFARGKKAWIYAGVPSFNKHRMNLDEIRSMHGSTVFTKAEDKQPERESIPAHV